MTPESFDAILSAGFFSLGLRSNAHALTEIVFLPPQANKPGQCHVTTLAVEQLNAWLKDPHISFNLPLQITGSAFRQSVWLAIRTIPTGETRSYGDLAKQLGSAPRAIGGACGDNPFPIVVPCHRVVAQSRTFNGGLGGFAHAREGLHMDIKRWLLDHERNAT